jgi:hypothetical protein
MRAAVSATRLHPPPPTPSPSPAVMEPFRVLARLRPVGGRPLPDGVGGGSLGPCAFPDPATDNGVRLVPRLPAHALNGSPETVGVDAVLPQTATQAAVFARVFGCGADGAGTASDSGHDGSAALCRLVDTGINVTLLAYGATGAWGEGLERVAWWLHRMRVRRVG